MGETKPKNTINAKKSVEEPAKGKEAQRTFQENVFLKGEQQ